MLQVKWYVTAAWCLFAVEEEISKVSLEFSIDISAGDLLSNLHVRMLHGDPVPPTGAVCDTNQHF